MRPRRRGRRRPGLTAKQAKRKRYHDEKKRKKRLWASGGKSQSGEGEAEEDEEEEEEEQEQERGKGGRGRGAPGPAKGRGGGGGSRQAASAGASSGQGAQPLGPREKAEQERAKLQARRAKKGERRAMELGSLEPPAFGSPQSACIIHPENRLEIDALLVFVKLPCARLLSRLLLVVPLGCLPLLIDPDLSLRTSHSLFSFLS